MILGGHMGAKWPVNLRQHYVRKGGDVKQLRKEGREKVVEGSRVLSEVVDK
jgi:hypothetical protein